MMRILHATQQENNTTSFLIKPFARPWMPHIGLMARAPTPVSDLILCSCLTLTEFLVYQTWLCLFFRSLQHWNVTPCSLVLIDWCFGGLYDSHFQGRIHRRYVSPNEWCTRRRSSSSPSRHDRVKFHMLQGVFPFYVFRTFCIPLIIEIRCIKIWSFSLLLNSLKFLRRLAITVGVPSCVLESVLNLH